MSFFQGFRRPETSPVSTAAPSPEPSSAAAAQGGQLGSLETGPVSTTTLGGEPGVMPSSSSTKAAPIVPLAPGRPVAVERTATSLTMAWAEKATDPPPDYDFVLEAVNPQIEYEVKYARSGHKYDLWNSVGVVTTQRWLRIHGLLPDQGYVFQVRARYRDASSPVEAQPMESVDVTVSRSAKLPPSAYKWSAASATSEGFATLLLDEQERFDNLGRLRQFIVDGAHGLPAYPEDAEIPDSVSAKAARTVEGIVTAVSNTGLGGTYFALVQNAWKIHKTGIASLIFHPDLQQTVYVLLNFLNTVAGTYGLSSKDVVVGSYFALWEAKRERLLYPMAEFEEHSQGQPGVLVSQVPQVLINELMFFFPLAGMAYRKSPAEIQWVLDKFTAADPRETGREDESWQRVSEDESDEKRGYQEEIPPQCRGSAQRGFRLIMSRTRSEKFKPAFFLAAHEELKTAVFVIRGTHQIEDVVTDGLCDVQAASFRFGEDAREFHVHAGMLQAAQWLVRGDDRRRHFEEDMRKESESEAKDGAGVGAAVAKLWAAGYRRVVFSGHSLGGGVAVLSALLVAERFRELRIRVYAYGTPAVVDEFLAEACKGPHGDPAAKIDGLGDRVTVKNIIRHDDLVPRLSLLTAKDFAVNLKETRSKWGPLLNEDIASFTSRIKTVWAPIQRAHSRKRTISRLQKQGKGSSSAAAGEAVADAAMEAEEEPRVPGETLPVAMDVVVEQPSSGTTTLLMGGAGITASNDVTLGQVAGAVVEAALPADPAVSGAETKPAVVAEPTKAQKEYVERLNRSFSNRLVVPGLIVHTYKHHGTHLASLVDYRFPGLRRISAFENCIDDHRFEEIMIAVRSALFASEAREAGRLPPHWESLLDHVNDENEWEVRCRVCTYPVSWHHTSGSEAFEIRATHHCHSCGKIVCSKCSEGRVALPHIGIITPVRVCDLCRYHLFEPRTGQKNMFDFDEF